MFPFQSLLVSTPHRSISIKEKISMKAKPLISAVCFIFALLTVAYAAGIDGKWTAQVPGRQGNTQEVTFNFKASGEKLEGTMSGRQGDTPISDGTIKGNDLTGGRFFREGDFAQ
jgi:hypothetical protein